jgi:FAD/FMN-containing dehydrogenase
LVEIIAAWESSPDDDGHDHRQWARTASDSLAPYALPGGYPNMLGPEEREQTAQAYGSNSGRLQQLKRLFDPDGVFTSAISLPVRKAA